MTATDVPARRGASLFTLDDLARARDIVGGIVAPTPQFAWPLLGEALGAEVWVKHEDCTPTGAFKVRGGLVYMEALRRERPHVAGVICATRGNHGQSIALAGRTHGVPVTIVAPHGNSPDKNAAMRGFGAELVEHGHDFQAAVEYARVLAAERGLEMVPSFHRDLALGVATYAWELFRAVDELDVVYVPVGLGSGICGLITVRDLLGLRTEIVGVVADGAPTTALSFEAGHVVSTDRADTFVDGVACRVPDADAMETIIAGAARIVRVADDVTADAVRLMMRTTHHMTEPAGAIATAGLIVERDRQAGRRIAVIQTGGNLDGALIGPLLAGETPTS
jgi:threonine dehydratase